MCARRENYPFQKDSQFFVLLKQINSDSKHDKIPILLWSTSNTHVLYIYRKNETEKENCIINTETHSLPSTYKTYFTVISVHTQCTLNS